MKKKTDRDFPVRRTGRNRHRRRISGLLHRHQDRHKYIHDGRCQD